jgi:hypothetical protein
VVLDEPNRFEENRTARAVPLRQLGFGSENSADLPAAGGNVIFDLPGEPGRELPPFGPYVADIAARASR